MGHIGGLPWEYTAQASSLGHDEEFDEPTEEATKVELAGFYISGLDHEKVYDTVVAQRLLVSTCKDMAFELVEGVQSPSEVWKQCARTTKQTGRANNHGFSASWELLQWSRGRTPTHSRFALTRTPANRRDYSRNGDSGENG